MAICLALGLAHTRFDIAKLGTSPATQTCPFERDACMSQNSKLPETSSRRTFLTSATLAAAAAAASTGIASGRAAAQAAASTDVGAVWWSELQTATPLRARAFYAAVMGWMPKVVALGDQNRAPEAGEKDYTLFTTDSREVAGAAQTEAPPGATAAAYWLTYVQVANVDLAALKAVELGGKLLEAPTDVPNTGRIAVIEDPEGARVALITPVTSASG
jgi:predicted enzyme related to lactoylglutathione lyase